MKKGLKVALFAITVVGLAVGGQYTYLHFSEPKGKGEVSAKTKKQKIVFVKK